MELDFDIDNFVPTVIIKDAPPNPPGYFPPERGFFSLSPFFSFVRSLFDD